MQDVRESGIMPEIENVPQQVPEQVAELISGSALEAESEVSHEENRSGFSKLFDDYDYDKNNLSSESPQNQNSNARLNPNLRRISGSSSQSQNQETTLGLKRSGISNSFISGLETATDQSDIKKEKTVMPQSSQEKKYTVEQKGFFHTFNNLIKSYQSFTDPTRLTEDSIKLRDEKKPSDSNSGLQESSRS